MRSCGDKFHLDKSERSTFQLQMLKHRHWVEAAFKINVTEKERDRGNKVVCKGMIDFRSFGILDQKGGIWRYERGSRWAGSQWIRGLCRGKEYLGMCYFNLAFHFNVCWLLTMTALTWFLFHSLSDCSKNCITHY